MIPEIFQRASVRTYTDEPVSEAQIEAILRAAMAAPSAGNQQPWEFYVSTTKEINERLATASPYAKPAGRAPLVITVCSRTEGCRFPSIAQQDLSAAIENMLLAAVNEGLGAVWMGVMPLQDRMDAIAEILQLPEGIEAFSMVAIGHPDGEVNAKGAERYDESRIHWV